MSAMTISRSRAAELGHVGAQLAVQQLQQQREFQLKGSTVWEGMVHVFDLEGHPKATRAYAWSSPIEGSTKRGFFAVLHGGDQIATRCGKGLCVKKSAHTLLALCSTTIAALTASCGDFIPPICDTAKNRRLLLPSNGGAHA
jgi:hypothetical protein